MSIDVNVTFYPQAWDAISRGPELHDFMQGKASDAADELRRFAPVRSGAGRRSITSRAVLGVDGWEGRATWDDEHYYMGILNSRTHWADPAVQRVRYV